MSNFEDSNDTKSISLEWLAMFTGIVTVIVSTYLIFGTEWNAYRVTNVVLGVAFLIFVTYAFTNSKGLKSNLSTTKAKAKALFAELEKTKTQLAETELELREKGHVIDQMKIDVASMEGTIGSLESKIIELEDQIKDALLKKK
jgi:septal ring factor EnvC (AmiA/AmiB activator)